jgi:hypothetical protein
MGKYSPTTYRPQPHVERPHPVWRGIGCIMMIIVPILSFGLAEITVQDAWAQQFIPYQLLGNPVMPPTLWKVGFLNPLLGFIQSQDNLYGVLVFFFLYLIVLGTFISAGNAFIYRSMGPPQYGPLDAPPPKVRVKRYKR